MKRFNLFLALFFALVCAPAFATDWPVHAGGDLQAAFNSAACGDTVTIDAGAQFNGSYTVGKSTCTAGSTYITIRTSAYASLPADGNRINNTTDVANMPILVPNTNGPVLTINDSSVGVKIIGIAFEAKTYHGTGEFFYAGNLNMTTDVMPDYLEIYHSYFKGDQTFQVAHGLVVQAKHFILQDSYIDNIFSNNTQGVSDAVGLEVCYSDGPYTIKNNEIISTAENIMLGGCNPIPLDGAIPQNITITGNYLYKPPSWKTAATCGYVKNSFEIKHGKNITFKGNIIDGTWKDFGGQTGCTTNGGGQDAAVMLVPRCDYTSGGNPYGILDTINVQYNKLVNVDSGGFSVAGVDDRVAMPNPANNACGTAWTAGTLVYGHSINIENNFIPQTTDSYNGFTQFKPLTVTSAGRDGTDEGAAHGLYVTGVYDHNTVDIASAANTTMYNDSPQLSYVWRDNIHLGYGSYGLHGFDVSGYPGYITSANFKNNVIQGFPSWWTNTGNTGFPASDAFPVNITDVGFTNYSTDYSLLTSSAYHNTASDGTDPGVTWSVFNPLMTHVVDGQTAGGGSPPPSTSPIVISGKVTVTKAVIQ